MKTSFLHVADCHLGKWQYNLRERFNDFGRAFHHIVNEAITAQVDFVVLAGDLFEKRAIDALTLNQAMRALDRLHEKGIPCLAIEGNHERPYYSERVGWMEFLAVRDLLILLTPSFEEGKAQLKPYVNRSGSYYDPLPGVRVHGLRYFGAGTATAIESYANALVDLPNDDIAYTIFMAHAGVEGVLAEQTGGLSHRQWSVLRPHIDYLALGHVHKPFDFDEWIYNPGSPESCSVAESEWANRGYYIVHVDTDSAHPVLVADSRNATNEDGSPQQLAPHEATVKHEAILHTNPRRTFHRISMKTDLLTSPTHLLDHCRELLQRKARDVGARELPAVEQPIVELQLTGVLPFDRSALDLAALDRLVQETFHPLMAKVKNFTRSSELAFDSADSLNRTELERQVLTDLLSRDARFQAKSEEWADITLTLKQLALSGASGEAILAEVGERLQL